MSDVNKNTGDLDGCNIGPVRLDNGEIVTVNREILAAVCSRIDQSQTVCFAGLDMKVIQLSTRATLCRIIGLRIESRRNRAVPLVAPVDQNGVG